MLFFFLFSCRRIVSCVVLCFNVWNSDLSELLFPRVGW